MMSEVASSEGEDPFSTRIDQMIKSSCEARDIDADPQFVARRSGQAMLLLIVPISKSVVRKAEIRTNFVLPCAWAGAEGYDY